MSSTDALVANAGIATTGPLVGGDPAAWDAMIDVNLRGILHGIAAALPVFASQGHGHFVTVTSTSAIKWVPGQGVYAATKAGVRALCEVLRQEIGPEIRATMVCPGATATEFTTDPELREKMATIAMEPEAVAQAIAWALGRDRSVAPHPPAPSPQRTRRPANALHTQPAGTGRDTHRTRGEPARSGPLSGTPPRPCRGRSPR